jgi:hypothetical protein
MREPWYPTQPKNGLTPISCHAVLERSACAPFTKERRVECINATSLRSKSGQMEHPAFIGERDQRQKGAARFYERAPFLLLLF